MLWSVFLGSGEFETMNPSMACALLGRVKEPALRLSRNALWFASLLGLLIVGLFWSFWDESSHLANLISDLMRRQR